MISAPVQLRPPAVAAGLVLGASLGLATVLALVLAACGPSVTSPGLTSPIDGIIVAVDGTTISDVRGFTLRIPGGRTIQFTLGALENPTQFPPGHLKEHEATSQPVRVYFAVQGSLLVVYRLEDAPGSSPWPPPTSLAPTSLAPTSPSPGVSSP